MNSDTDYDSCDEHITDEEEITDDSINTIIKNKVSSTMKFYILKKKLTKPMSIFNTQIKDVLDYETPYKV